MPDDCRQIWDLRLTWHGKSRAEVIPESDAELRAILIEAEKGVAAVATNIASGAAADLSLGLPGFLALAAFFRTWTSR
jgi:hypothetical protein